MILGDAVLKLETFARILHHVSRFIAWSLFTLVHYQYSSLNPATFQFWGEVFSV